MKWFTLLAVFGVPWSAEAVHFQSFGHQAGGDISLSFELISNTGLVVRDSGEFYAWRSGTPDAFEARGYLTPGTAIALNGIAISRPDDGTAIAGLGP